MLAKKFGFGFGIAVVLPLLVYYGVSTFHPPPQWSDYMDSGYFSQFQDATPEEKERLQEENRKRHRNYQRDRKMFTRKFFYVAAPVGMIAIVIGSLLSVQAIGAGLIFGGIFTLIHGYLGYWGELPNWMRFLSLLCAFIILTFMAYAKISDRKNG